MLKSLIRRSCAKYGAWDDAYSLIKEGPECIRPLIFHASKT